MRRAGDTMGSVLRQAFMSKDEYQELRDEDKVLRRLQRPFTVAGAALLFLIIFISAFVALKVVFPSKGRPFCSKYPLPPSVITDDSMHSFYFTEYEATRYFWLVCFLPTCIIFLVSGIYLFAGMLVAYTAPNRHACIKVVENNCCASKKGGVRCLATLNVSFAVVFGLMALFLGSSILTLQTDCSITLFWCYEMISWSLVLLYASTFFFLRRKAAVIMDEGEYYGSRTTGMELLEASAIPIPEMEERVNAAFGSWMGSSILSSDDEEEEPLNGSDSYHSLDDVRSVKEP